LFANNLLQLPVQILWNFQDFQTVFPFAYFNP